MSHTARTPWPQRPNLKTSRGRAAQRMIQLEQMEREMLIEEREGLQMTEVSLGVIFFIYVFHTTL